MGTFKTVCLTSLVVMVSMLATERRVAAAPALAAPSCSVANLRVDRPTHISLVPAAAQVQRNNKADITFVSRRTNDGALQVEARGGDLSFRKTVTSDGSFVLELETPEDAVTVRFSAGTAAVTRGSSTASVDFHDASLASLNVVRRLLADSSAVQLTRVAAANLMDSDDNSPESAAVLIADAFLGTLAGDAGALGRLGKHLSRHVREGIRRAAVNCYYDWETLVIGAWNDYMGCLDEISLWNPIRVFCAPRYLLMVEAYWFQFLSCVGFSGFLP